MASLEDVLSRAGARSAYEIVIESGQPVVMTTAAGPETLDGVLGENDLIDALTSVLNPEQQVELAVGNLIEFQLDSPTGRWTMVTEPAAEGVLVRGRLQGAPGHSAPPPVNSGGRGSGFDLPALEPFIPDDGDGAPTAPGRKIGTSFEHKPTVRDLAFGFPDVGAAPPAQTGEFDISSGATDQTLFNPGGPAPMGGAPGPGGTLDDLDFGSVETPGGDGQAATLYSDGGPAPVPRMGPAEPLDPATADDLGFGESDPGARLQSGSDTLHLGSNPARPDAGPTAPMDFGVAGIVDDDDDSTFSARPATEPRPEPAATPRNAAAGATGGELESAAAELGAGTLCFVHGDVAEALAELVGSPFYVVDDSAAGTRTMRSALDEQPGSGTIVIRSEDPSARLGWLLRRLEEGWCVLVETRARTPEGARRILLGVDASAQATQWLDEQELRWLVADGATGWVLR